MVPWWAILISCILVLLIGMGFGFYFSKKYFEKQLKANPPINENMIRSLYAQVGRKPTEAQIKQMINSVMKFQTTSTSHKK
ncbi:YneF family protein [Mycoplasma sp. SG1]|uniref:YneF family protein n=1 Tax=Mycoplasma sp. SG1 TaxID=2810348 RepID=UPI002023EABE|nr:YneF family protein [Mycoplasma sp. SG1]URM53071.1 YneF family protein [Mycoplasma sp. SG1]